LPTAGTTHAYTSRWNSDEIPVLTAVKQRFVVGDPDATRLGVYLLSFLVALGGH
jgi:hypothetical protein